MNLANETRKIGYTQIKSVAIVIVVLIGAVFTGISALNATVDTLNVSIVEEI